MTLYKTTLTPASQFATPLRGDTLFGQLCWSIRHIYGNVRLEALLGDYAAHPFAIISDAFAPGYLPKPVMPSRHLGEDALQKKQNRKKVWLTPEQLRLGEYAKAITDKEAGVINRQAIQMHNSLNYKSFTTDDQGFAPYGSEVERIGAKELYVLIDESRLSAKELHAALTLIGHGGYGKDATIGKGRFTLCDLEPEVPQSPCKAVMTLSPCSLEGFEAQQCYYEPFTRFGKFGDARARGNAFKKPLLLADTGAVAQFEAPLQTPYIGRAVTKVSTVYTDAVHQGYAIVMPIKELS